MKTSDLFNFEIKDNYAEADNCKVFFLRFSPPNLNIMTQGEKLVEIQRFQELYDSLGNLHYQTFSLDKTENLKENRDYWASLIQSDDIGDYRTKIQQAIINKIDSIESTSSSVGRAFYFVLKSKDAGDLSRMETCLGTKGIHYYIADKQEIVTVLRNFILREFIGFDIYDFESEVEKSYADQSKNKGRRKKAAG